MLGKGKGTRAEGRREASICDQYLMEGCGRVKPISSALTFYIWVALMKFQDVYSYNDIDS